MKKLSVKIISIALAICLLIGVVPMSIFAEESDNNVYVDVTLEADKTDYADGDSIVFNGAIANSSSKDCDADVEISLYATPSIKLDTKLLKINALAAGESHDLTVEAVAKRTRFGFELIQAIYDIITGYLYTIVLEVVSLFSSNYECVRVYIDGIPAAVLYKVDSSVVLDDGESNDNDIVVTYDVSDMLYDSENRVYYLNSNFDGKINGYVEGELSSVSKMSYTVYNEEGSPVSSGDITPNPEWSIDNIGLVVGFNRLKVNSLMKNGKISFAEISLITYNPDFTNDLNVDKKDDDNDGLLNYLEDYYGTDRSEADTDGDGLNDYFEIIEIGTDPTKTDSDNNGTNDSNEDHDNDGIINIEEITLGTNPVGQDTDLDGLVDGDEINVHSTDPLNADTDDDGADDFWEIENGFDPCVPQESFVSTASSSDGYTNASVELQVDGAQADTLEVKPDIDNNRLDSSIPGYIGSPYSFTIDGTFDEATITFSFDKELAVGTDKFNPAIYYFNEETQQLEELETEVDYENGTAIAKVNHFSTYILLNKVEFDKVWNDEIKPPEYQGTGMTGIDVVFVVDSSGSMSGNDGSKIRIKAVKEFIDKLGENDRAAVVDFDDYSYVYQDFTSDHDLLYSAINRVNSSGGTSLSAGMSTAINLFTNSDYTRTDAYKYIIFLTDGNGSYSTSYTTSAANNNIVVYTVGLGSGVSENVLKSIANGTGGKYYFASTATNLPNIYDEVSFETVDYSTDSNNDGISDYYTKILCEEGTYLNGAKNPFYYCSFEHVQSNDDYDNDGLKNGEEIIITVSGDKTYVKMVSNPTTPYSDKDAYNDYEEIKTYKSDALVTNVTFEKNDTDYLINDDNFVSKKYLDFYENKWYGWAERGGIWIGNNIFGSNYDVTYMYKCILMDYLEKYVDESSEADAALEYLDYMVEALSTMSPLVDEAIKVAKADDIAMLENLKQQIVVAQKNMNDLRNGDLINNGFTKDEVYDMFDDVWDQYVSATEKTDALSKKVEFKTKFGKFSKAVGVVLEVADVAITIHQFFDNYSDFTAKIESMDDCVTTLNTIKNSHHADDKLKQACSELIKAIEAESTKNSDKFWDGFNNIGGKVLRIGASHAVVLIPVVGPYLEAANIALGIIDFVFNFSDVAQACTYLYAITKSAQIISDSFESSISSGYLFNNYLSVYNSPSKCALEYFDLAIMRITSEEMMQKANKANAFFIEWLFTEIMYKSDDIEKNISKVEKIQNKYYYATAY